MRETQEGCPSPLKSIVFETFLRFQKLGSVVKILFWHAKYRGICLGFLYGGEWSVGDTDCHSQCAHWLRNDTVNKRCGVRADVGSGPYGEVAKGAVKESPSHGFAVPAPFRQGGRGDGGDGLPRALCALAMTGVLAIKKGCR